MPNRRILIVDDNPVNLKLARVTLAGQGYEIVTAASARGALAEIAACPPDLVLLDIQLPGTDGLALTRVLRNDTTLDGIRILAVSAYASEADEDRAIAAGCDAFITKPIDTRRLPGIVARHLAMAEIAAAGADHPVPLSVSTPPTTPTAPAI